MYSNYGRAISAEEALKMLAEGNEKFAHEHYDRKMTLSEIVELDVNGQHPFATVITCSDSRVPPELIFDCELGDIFTIRTAGNVVSNFEIGSAEYAAEHLHTRLIVVMGHLHCGAVGSCCEDHSAVEGFLKNIMVEIEPSVAAAKKIAEKNGGNVAEIAEDENIRHTVNVLRSNSVLRHCSDVKIIGAKYDTHTGKVTFFKD